MKHLFFLILLFAVACSAFEPGKISTTAQILETATVPHLQTNRTVTQIVETVTIESPAKPATKTQKSTSTPRPTFLPTNTSDQQLRVTPTVTFDLANIRTKTPSEEEQCPAPNPEIRPKIQIDSYNQIQSDQLENAILEYLNAGGSPQNLLAYLRLTVSEPGKRVVITDVTGDNSPDLVIAGIGLFVFGCSDGKFVTLLLTQNDPGLGHRVEIIAVRDLNMDGQAEIVIRDIACTEECGTEIRVLEWDGSSFDDVALSCTPFGDCDQILSANGIADISIKDIDRNGFIELMIIDKGPVGMDRFEAAPVRTETRVYMWNGKLFALHSDEFDKPKYRFQAVQDGDRAVLVGNYEQALGFYQQAIFDSNLEWWTVERKQFLQDEAIAKLNNDPMPKPPIIDQNEYPNLAAYSRFRIMLLHLLQGNIKEAQTVYTTILEMYPTGSPGNTYAQLSTAFWKEYQINSDIRSACNEAVRFATEHQAETLNYIGSDYLGWQSLQYDPEDICPFK